MHRVRGFDLQCRETIALRVIGQIRDLAREIRSRRRVSTIILYGSFARGDFHEASDIDLIVVGDFRERFHKRAATILDLTDLPIEPICYTDEEFAELVRKKNPFIHQALAEGIRV
ncbi:nucleotidyltransferase domain-containing protein [Methanoculleus sp. UBA413]|uniref:nucleotidyltransferase domain-containing protein n=1 Tax=Methanoculleus sp. UBA413 TaxID=1915509 RepID=UPI00257C3741|nr:nucleotidyltransferase domain-containing protein [Methanoculleus sp. UBA413]